MSLQALYTLYQTPDERHDGATRSRSTLTMRRTTEIQGDVTLEFQLPLPRRNISLAVKSKVWGSDGSSSRIPATPCRLPLPLINGIVLVRRQSKFPRLARAERYGR